MFQVGSDILDACMLALLINGDAYGYKLTQDMKELINVSESTLYPVLRRLEKENMLDVYDKPYSGRNRRYYSITKKGKEKLLYYKKEWQIFSENINKILLIKGEIND